MNLTEQLIRRGDHRSVYTLEADIRAWVKNWNADPKPFVWTNRPRHPRIPRTTN